MTQINYEIPQFLEDFLVLITKKHRVNVQAATIDFARQPLQDPSLKQFSKAHGTTF